MQAAIVALRTWRSHINIMLHASCFAQTATFIFQPWQAALQNVGNMDKSSTALLGGMTKGKGAPSGSSPLGPKPEQGKGAARRPDAEDKPPSGGIAAFPGPAGASGSAQVSVNPSGMQHSIV